MEKQEKGVMFWSLIDYKNNNISTISKHKAFCREEKKFTYISLTATNRWVAVDWLGGITGKKFLTHGQKQLNTKWWNLPATKLSRPWKRSKFFPMSKHARFHLLIHLGNTCLRKLKHEDAQYMGETSFLLQSNLFIAFFNDK